MKTKHLKKRIKYFKAKCGLNKKGIKEYMRECPDTLIHLICEGCFNLYHHQILKDVDFEDKEKDALNDYLKI